jgi:hypothetical protein
MWGAVPYKELLLFVSLSSKFMKLLFIKNVNMSRGDEGK